MKKTEAPKVCVVIVNWNGKQDTIECLASLRKISYRNFEIIVVDNGSVDGSAQAIRDKFSSILVLENGKNLGLAEGNNIGIRTALRRGAEWVLLLNNDVLVKKDFLAQLVKSAQAHEKIALAGPKIMYYPEKKRIWSAGLQERFFAEPCSRGLGELDKRQFEKEEFVDSIHGVMLLNAKALQEIGLLYSDFFIMVEESEWGIRAKRRGWNVLFVPSSVVWHKVSRSVDKLEKPRAMSVYYTVRNWMVALKRDYGLLAFASVFLLNLFFLSWYRIAKYLFLQPQAIEAYALALLDSALGRMPKRFVS
jgi:hypothetical protein